MRVYTEITGLAGSGKTTLAEILVGSRGFEKIVRGFPPRSKTKEVLLSFLVFPVYIAVRAFGLPASRRWEILSILKFAILLPINTDMERVTFDQGFLHSWVSLNRSIYCFSHTVYSLAEPLLLWLLRRGLQHYCAIIHLSVPIDELIKRVSKRAKRHSTDTMSRQETFIFYDTYSKFFELMFSIAKELNVPVTILDTQALTSEEAAARIMMR